MKRPGLAREKKRVREGSPAQGEEKKAEEIAAG